MIYRNHHDEGFSKEAVLKEMFHKDRNGFRSFMAFKASLRAFNPELCENAFERRQCRRTLRYIGYSVVPEIQVGKNVDPDNVKFFVPGNIYFSTSFNGSTYEIEGYSDIEGGRIIGCNYFDWVKD